ncbi:M1 family metallopeptidase [Saccharomonospora xinjiangensis]|uniref:M1 family metallopeptidase n=1 Tax=Saccharomonospora xinjiangensis TaxID=75294 RepID=UPI00106F164D|nr:M1 family metallopeptidase [Saccharomonospora xinjiangensis]QBQ62269.1 Aminopeptidase N [Saccharomonospora xinjiangensis]
MVDRRIVWTSLGGLACIVAACTSPPVPSEPAPAPTHGAAGIGDEYYPEAGNGGYDVDRYELDVRYDPERGQLTGEATVTARATQRLSRFNLDLRGFTVSSVEVDGAIADFAREDSSELVVTPPEPLDEGSVFATRVRYEGKPVAAKAGQLGGNGWYRSPSGGAFVFGEPQSASFWYPVNEHPRDKAAFSLTATVPKGWTAVSIGKSGKSTTKEGWTTTNWTEPDPVASYLTVFAVDRFDVETGELADGTPVRNVFAPGADDARDEAARTAEIVEYLESRFGDYPASTAGGIYLDSATGFALETQGTPTYPSGPDVDLLVHEIAHQWYGNSVSVHSWADICLNECFASYATWLWAEDKHGADLDSFYRERVEMMPADLWAEPLYDMGAGNEFGAVYVKGPLAVHALRMRIGDESFDELLRRWPAEHENGNASWEEFEDFAERVSGQDLDEFFKAWFRDTERPADEHLHPARPSR